MRWFAPGTGGSDGTCQTIDCDWGEMRRLIRAAAVIAGRLAVRGWRYAAGWNDGPGGERRQREAHPSPRRTGGPVDLLMAVYFGRSRATQFHTFRGSPDQSVGVSVG